MKYGQKMRNVVSFLLAIFLIFFRLLRHSDALDRRLQKERMLFKIIKKNFFWIKIYVRLCTRKIVHEIDYKNTVNIITDYKFIHYLHIQINILILFFYYLFFCERSVTIIIKRYAELMTNYFTKVLISFKNI